MCLIREVSRHADLAAVCTSCLAPEFHCNRSLALAAPLPSLCSAPTSPPIHSQCSHWTFSSMKPRATSHSQFLMQRDESIHYCTGAVVSRDRRTSQSPLCEQGAHLVADVTWYDVQISEEQGLCLCFRCRLKQLEKLVGRCWGAARGYKYR